MDIINASGMRFSRKLRFRTAEIGFIWLMTSAEYAGDTSLFVGIQNVLLRENGGNFYAYITGTDFLLGLLMAAICQKIHLPRIIGMLFTGISNTKPRQLS